MQKSTQMLARIPAASSLLRGFRTGSFSSLGQFTHGNSALELNEILLSAESSI
jgi:hypothetical protein